MVLEKYDPQRMYEAFKPLRNKIRKINPYDIIFQCSKLLYKCETGDTKMLSTMPPWFLLLLIKWALIYGDFVDKKKSLRNGEINILINHIHSMFSFARLPSQYDNHYLFFKNISFQQLWLQENYNKMNFFRQNYLFYDKDGNNYFNKKFLFLYGITVSEFLELGLCLYTNFILNKSLVVHHNYFRNLSTFYNQSVIDSFWMTLSKDLESTKHVITRHEYNDLNEEVHEQSPLVHCPLLNLDNGSYLCYSSVLLYHTLKDFVYDKLRNSSPNEFMNYFGPKFEKYIKKLIEDSNVQYLDEHEIKIQYGTGKVVDFMIDETESVILIDAKGTEMSDQGKISDYIGDILNCTKNSCLKGIEQGFDLASRLNTKKEIFLIIVTYKDMYVGNGYDYYHYYAKKQIDTIKVRYKDDLIPMKNIFFLSVLDFELLVECVKEKDIEIHTVLQFAREQDLIGSTKKFIFRDHLKEMGYKFTCPKHINDSFTQIFDKILRCLKVDAEKS